MSKKPVAAAKAAPEVKKPAPVKTAAKKITKSSAPANKPEALAAAAAQLAATQTPIIAAKPAAKKAADKADREAERAKRYPNAAKKEAEKAADKAGGKKAPREKVVKETVEFVNRALKKGASIHVLSITARPTSGSRLAAHTHAALSILGMLDVTLPKVPVAAVRTIMGDRAIAWHTKQNNFVTGPDHTIGLTPAGRSNFLARPVDGRVANAFVDMFIDGKVDEAVLGVKAGEVYQAKVM